MPSTMANGRYRSLSSSDPELSGSDMASERIRSMPSSERPWKRFGRVFAVVLGVFMSFLAAFTLGRHLGYTDATNLHQYIQEQSCNLHGDAPPSSEPPLDWKADSSVSSAEIRCSDPYFRNEWRMLSRQEKLDYIKAARCLTNTPSVIRQNGTIHDDFAFVHNMHAHSTHGKAAFFSWHRRFISVYEQYLQEKCSYHGSLPYWDWTLDWENLAESPIFSATIGFGGNGNESAPSSVGEGHCVTEGPFADLQPLFYGPHVRPHCLSRGFTDFPGRNASPAVVQTILEEKDYESFFLGVENGPHNVAPNGIRGDFYSFTAPYDPIFYLHHAQLDRLWFIWQQKDQKRMAEYSGMADSDEDASLNDLLSMGGLEHDVRVSQVMDTQSGGLCYRYALT